MRLEFRLTAEGLEDTLYKVCTPHSPPEILYTNSIASELTKSISSLVSRHSFLSPTCQ